MIGKMFANSVDSSYLSNLTLHWFCVFDMWENNLQLYQNWKNG